MINLFHLLQIALCLSLTSSCIEKNHSTKEVGHSEFISYSTTDSLKFTSGIRCIFQDSKGNYWLGSHHEGVCLFDGQTFTYFTTENGLANNQVRSIQEDQNGNVWFGTGNGVSSYNGTGMTTYSPLTTGIMSRYLPSKWEKTDQDLWFNAGNQSGVYRYDGQSLHYLTFPLPQDRNPNDSYFVTSLAAGKNDMLWIATYPGVFGYNGSQLTIINAETLGLEKEDGYLHIRSIFEDSKGRLWIGNNGLGVLLKIGEVITNFSESQNMIHPNSSRNGSRSPDGTLEHVFTIQEDLEGNIWFGDRDTGTWKFDGKTMTNYTIDPTLSSPMVWSIYQDSQNQLLFGMANGGVYKFNGASFDKVF